MKIFHSRTLRVYPQGGGILEPSNLRVFKKGVAVQSVDANMLVSPIAPTQQFRNSSRDFIICLRCLNWDASQGLPVTSHLCGFNKYPVHQTQPSSAHPNAIPKLLLLIGNSVVSEWWTTLTSNPTLHVGTCWVAKTVFLFGFQASLTWHGFAIGKKESPLHHHWTKCNTITRSSPLTTFGFRAFPLKVSHEGPPIKRYLTTISADIWHHKNRWNDQRCNCSWMIRRRHG